MLPDAPSICRLHLDFMKWADEKMFSLVQTLSPEVCNQPNGVSFESLAGTVQHIYRGERIWYRRVAGEASVQLSDVETPTLDEIAGLWPQLHEDWRRWAAELDANQWFQSILSKNSHGVESRLPYWQIVLHLVNHGSYHRGQVMSLVRQSGAQPVATDLIAYYRVLASKTNS